MTNDKKLMLLAGVLALGMLAGCSSASAASAASGMAGSMPAASEVEEVSSEVRVLPGEEGVIMPINQGSLEEMKTGSYKFAANISSVDAKKRQMTLTVYGYDAYRAEDVDALDVGSVFSTHLDGAVEAQNVTVEKIEKNEDNGTVSINGGIEEGGVDLWRSGDIYRTVTYDDYPVYYMMGELVLPVDDSVTLSDSSASVDAVRWRRTAPSRWARPSRRTRTTGRLTTPLSSQRTASSAISSASGCRDARFLGKPVDKWPDYAII